MIPLKLDIGCGGRGSRQKGFIGIDIHPRPPGKSGAEYLRLDFIRDPLPWGRFESVDEAIALHIIEHLTRDEGKKLIRLAIEMLMPGASITITCPDLAKICRAYVDGDDSFLQTKHINGGKEIWPGRTPADRVNWAIHQDGHNWAYDEKSLRVLALEVIGDYPATVEPLQAGSRWSTRPDHECGIVITKGQAR